jgi:hypothetical protein
MHTPLSKGIQGDLKEIVDLTLRQQMQTLELTLSKINDWVQKRIPVSLTTPNTHTGQGMPLWIKEWNVQPLKPHWRGPFVFVLSTPITVKVEEIVPWIHNNRVKPASLEWECIPDPASLCRITLQNVNTLPQPDSASQETTGNQEWWDDSPAFFTLGR